MNLSLKKADLTPDHVDYVCAHGNSLVDYDASETAAIKLVFIHRSWSIPVSSIKSMSGQALAASGAMQIVASSHAIRDDEVQTTINYQLRNPLYDLDYVPITSRSARVRTLLIHPQTIRFAH